MDLATLCAAVDDAFAVTSAGLSSWPSPRGTWDEPREEEYSRCLDPGKFRLIGARADAWVQALVDLGLATALEAEVPPVTTLTPSREGALRLYVAKAPIDDVPDASVSLAVDRASLQITSLPECGCDACDEGSDRELEELDEKIVNVVTGGFAHVAGRGGEAMTNLDGSEATGDVPMEAWLADAVAGRTPPGTVVTRGLPWWE